MTTATRAMYNWPCLLLLAVSGAACIASGKSSPSHARTGLYATTGPSWPDCNGNGIKYVDTRTCECFTCFYGANSDCSRSLDELCFIDDVSGNPLLAQEYWAFEAPKAEHNNITTISRASYRSGYSLGALAWEPNPNMRGETQNRGVTGAMSKLIRRVHQKVGNVKTDGYWIVPANGATQLIGAAIYGISKLRGSSNVYAKAPYYSGYKENSQVIGGVRFCNLKSAEDVSAQAGCVNDDGTPVVNSSDIIEFVTVPNNPDNSYRTPVYPNSHVVHDMAYNWPHLITSNTPTRNFDGDVMIFTLSKLSGHAGTRFGWALVKDEMVAKSMSNYVSLTSLEVSHDALHRAWTILGHIATHGDIYFSYMRTIMEARRNDMEATFANIASFSYQSSKEAATFYIFLKCEMCTPGGESAKSLFERKTGIAVSGGENFGYPVTYVRLHVVLRSHTWPIFISRLRRLD